MRRSLAMIKLITLSVCVFYGCTTAKSGVQQIIPGSGEALVFGRIVLFNTKNQENGKVFVKEENQEMATSYQLSHDGLFCWKLKPGKYTIVSYRIKQHRGQFRYGWGRIWVNFEVPAYEQYFYIGSLLLNDAFVSEITIEDDYNFDKDKIIKRFGLEKRELNINLMMKEKV